MYGVTFDEEVESLARSVKRVPLRTTRLGIGYDRSEVDAFLAAVIDKVRCGECVSPPRFSETRMRPGYVMSDVDSLIAEVFRLGPPPVPRQAPPLA
jgi:DivIVA domain-containing protein